jgi:S-adenosyl-L-methionine hydrolase (adenosine-forming)
MCRKGANPAPGERGAPPWVLDRLPNAYNTSGRNHPGGEKIVAGKIEGVVESVSDEGNLVTSITAEELRKQNAPTDESVTVVCEEHETLGIFQPDHQQPPMTYIALIGAGGKLELAIVGDSARMMLGVREGAAVLVKW